MAVLPTCGERTTSRFAFLYTFSFALLTFAFMFLLPVIASPADVTLAWDANTESNLAGYRIYYKTDFSGPPYDGLGGTEGDSPITVPLEGLNNSDYPEYTIHGLSDAKTYFYVATAYDTEDDESTYSNEVYNLCSHILPPMAEASFTASPPSGFVPFTVDFLDQSTGEIESWSWDFGDDGISTEQNPLHTYHKAGIYTVRLVVSGPDGCDDEIKTDFITVYPPHIQVGDEGLETGLYERTGKGKNKIATFVLTDTFQAGEGVVIRTYIIDAGTAMPVANGIAEIAINDLENSILISEPSGTDGIAEATWKTSAPRGKKAKGGTTPGVYEATVTNLVADGYLWDGNSTFATFVIQ